VRWKSPCDCGKLNIPDGGVSIVTSDIEAC
jgi:hypothetical protein